MPANLLWWLLLALWTLWVLQAWLSAWKMRKFLGRCRRPLRRKFADYRPPVCVIVPFKGVDKDLASGVRGLCEQDYPDYRLLLVVESQDDPAYPVLTRELAHYSDRRAELLVAGPAAADQGQKVHNQLFALNHVYDTSPDREVWVFADSDAVPGPDWLVRLVEPLKEGKKTGVTTGYRWMVPDEPATLWSHLASVINSSIACFMGRDEFNHAWGGSMALRARTARRGDLRRRWTGALSDDYQMTRLCQDLGLRIYFVPRCLVASPVHFDLRGLLSFGRRQYLITRVHAPGLWLAALLINGLYVAGFVSAVVAAIVLLVRDPGGLGSAIPFGTIVLVCLGDQLRATLRRKVVRACFGEEGLGRLRATLRYDRWATPLWMGLHFLIVASAAFGRTIRWRGIAYRLRGPQQIERLDAARGAS